jgi:hypothetical protein
VNQLTEIDHLTIVSDMNHELVADYINSFDFKCKVNHISNETTLGYWGHGSRNAYQNTLEGDFILNGDDDDRYVEGCFDYIRSVVTEKKLYVFKHQSGNATAWSRREIQIGNIGTSCGVIPNTKNLPMWEYFYGGDGAFYESLSRMMDYEFVDCVIYKVRDTP